MTVMNFKMLDPTEGEDFIVRMMSNELTRRQRLLALGEPGCGKSFMFAAAAKRTNHRFIDLRLLQLELGAFRGLERIIELPDGTVETMPVRPYFLPPYTAPEDIDENTIYYMILLEEIMACDDAIRKTAFELLTEHRSGPHLLGPNVVIYATGNTAEDGTNVHEMDRATKRRFTFFGMHTSAEGVVEYGMRKGWHHHVLSFIKNNPTFLTQSEEDEKGENLAIPNPASYELCSDTLKAFDQGFLTREDVETSILGNIGTAAGSEMLLQIEDEDARFDLQAIIAAKPDDRQYPKNVFGVHSLGNALAAWADDGEKLDHAVDIMIGMPNGSTAHPYEAKTQFIYQIGDKMTKFRRFGKYSDNAHVLELLEDTGLLTKHKDEEYEAQQKANEEAEQAGLQIRQAA